MSMMAVRKQNIDKERRPHGLGKKRWPAATKLLPEKFNDRRPGGKKRQDERRLKRLDPNQLGPDD